MANDKIAGRNPVLEVLKSGRDVDKILVTKGAGEGSINKIVGIAKDKGIPIQFVDKQKINDLAETKSHQGVVAFVAAYKYSTVEDILQKSTKQGTKPFILILDEIMDPHNLGSIMRTADATGVDGIIIPKRRSVGLTATVAKTSAGAIEYVPVAKVSNISQTIEKLKSAGVWVIGADMDGEKAHYDEAFDGPIALVLGNEGQGISRLVKEKCDFLINIPMGGKVSSLNASVAGSILMYEAFRQRR
ncbi:23S rRNA (guanosine(2251)-2'-O)-methyltransferase RlmB [Serpentinicella sp. ANB-PHB4]|uniref:23S rRNA (guanosine(2251)-2'-O)-methyltransferase RlmB n=1 Tax=Serpentinicella sp. ANB-PHB4 TaxID=3074076 RepID=UPI00285EA5C0|nr:23S rRNA (guanosine(2251)-2'-O)-methyltransferase RlmB [Serpentinicella sp. ANB-PHB4]MDR5659930.1 23S rRNA (guanosine(2251)-2'-O)-methyltransferase RlmB [Serpentinicella sp. ANB-PHB4]